jgi:hypothetical protein
MEEEEEEEEEAMSHLRSHLRIRGRLLPLLKAVSKQMNVVKLIS